MQTVTTSSNETEALGKRLASNLHGSEAIELVSDLGGGKTTFVRGLAKGLGSTDHVSSPTFTVCNVYKVSPKVLHVDGVQGDNQKQARRINNTVSESRKQTTQQSATSSDGVVGFANQQNRTVRELWHYDFYRVGDNPGHIKQELQEALGNKDAVLVVEWADAVSDVLPKDRLTIALKAVTENEREISINCPSELQYLVEGL